MNLDFNVFEFTLQEIDGTAWQPNGANLLLEISLTRNLFNKQVYGYLLNINAYQLIAFRLEYQLIDGRREGAVAEALALNY